MWYNKLIIVFVKGFVKTTGGLLSLGIGYQLYNLWTQDKKVYKNQDDDEKKKMLKSLLENKEKQQNLFNFEIENGIKEESDKYKNLFD